MNFEKHLITNNMLYLINSFRLFISTNLRSLLHKMRYYVGRTDFSSGEENDEQYVHSTNIDSTIFFFLDKFDLFIFEAPLKKMFVLNYNIISLLCQF